MLSPVIPVLQTVHCHIAGLSGLVRIQLKLFNTCANLPEIQARKYRNWPWPTIY